MDWLEKTPSHTYCLLLRTKTQLTKQFYHLVKSFTPESLSLKITFSQLQKSHIRSTAFILKELLLISNKLPSVAKLIACVDSIFGRNYLSHTCYKGVLFSKENVTLGILHKVSQSRTKQTVQQNNINFFFCGRRSLTEVLCRVSE